LALVRITLEDCEHVVPYGARQTTWFVRVRDAWVAARAADGAHLENLEAGPGTVWRQCITVELVPGTRLMRVESMPQQQRKTPLEYLASRAVPVARAVKRREFQLSPEGKLVALDGPRPSAPKRKNLGK
jgi:hypothetical protein